MYIYIYCCLGNFVGGNPRAKGKISSQTCIRYFRGISPQGGGEKFLSQLKNGEEFEGGLEKRKGKEENKERVIKHTLKYLYEAQITAKISTKTGKNFRGGVRNFSGWPEYIPLNFL